MDITFFQSNYFVNYLLFFSVFASILWFYYYLGLYLFKTPVPTKPYKGKVCAVIPCYNEDPENMIETLYCVKACKYIDDFVFVDDGSKNNTQEIFKRFLKKENYIICEKNGGKRNAQAVGMRYLAEKYGEDYFDIVVMLDSDTVLLEDSVYNLIQRMQFKDVGAVTSNVLVKNRDDNWFTKCLSAMYWSSSNIWRQAPANYGYMQVTNGQLSVYRFKPIYELLPEYLKQTFCGRKCAFSDDRWFTQHLQTDHNLRIDYEKTAIAYTYVPNRIKQCWKMFMRWKKGSLRETLLVSKHIKTHPMLVLDCWWNHIVSILQLVVRLSILIIAFSYPLIIVYYILIVSMVSVIYGLNMLLENPREIPYRIGYSFLNEVLFGFIIIMAIIKIRDQGWSTR